MALLILLFLTATLQLTDNQVLPLLLKTLGEDVWPGVGGATTWLLVTYPLGAALGPLLVTRWLPSFQGRLAIMSGLLVLAATEVLFALAPPFGAALLLRYLAGIASGVLSYALLIEAVAAGNLAVTVMTSGFLLAYMGGIPTGAKLVDAFGLESLYLGLGAVAVLLATMAVFTLRPAPAPRDGQRPRPFSAFLADARYRNGLLTSVLVGAALAGPVALFPSVLQAPEGAALSLDRVADVYYVAGLGPLLALPFAARLIGGMGRRPCSIAGACALAAAILLMPAGSGAWWSAATLLLGALLVETLRRSALQAHLGSLPPREDRPRYLSLRNVCVQVSVSGGIAWGKLLADAGGLALTCSAAAVLALLSAVLVPRSEPEVTLTPDP